MKMKSRMNRIDADEKTSKIAHLKQLIHEYEGAVSDLGRQIRAEEYRTRSFDPADIAYSTFAKSTRERRDKLRLSVDALRVKLEATQRERDDALEHLNPLDSAAS